MKSGRGSAPRAPMHRREVVQATVDGRIVYQSAKDHGAWTDDIAKARIWRHPGYARQQIFVRKEWEDNYGARVVDARTVPGYVDKTGKA